MVYKLFSFADDTLIRKVNARTSYIFVATKRNSPKYCVRGSIMR